MKSPLKGDNLVERVMESIKVLNKNEEESKKKVTTTNTGNSKPEHEHMFNP